MASNHKHQTDSKLLGSQSKAINSCGQTDSVMKWNLGSDSDDRYFQPRPTLGHHQMKFSRKSRSSPYYQLLGDLFGHQ